jgi:hypothetical protein
VSAEKFKSLSSIFQKIVRFSAESFNPDRAEAKEEEEKAENRKISHARRLLADLTEDDINQTVLSLDVPLEECERSQEAADSAD